MIQSILNMMIGPWGRAVLDFYFAHQTVINIIFLVWAGTITYGSVQLNKIRKVTVLMAVKILEKHPKMSNEQLWDAFRPQWQEQVAKLDARYVLNRWNFWVTRPTPEALIELMRLSPDWFAAIRKGEVLTYRFALPGRNNKLSSIVGTK